MNEKIIELSEKNKLTTVSQNSCLFCQNRITKNEKIYCSFFVELCGDNLQDAEVSNELTCDKFKARLSKI